LDLTSLSDISKFIGYYKSGKLSPKMKSEKKPTTNDGPVTIVVGNTFEEYVAGPNNQEDVLIEFYAPWCGHCKRCVLPVLLKIVLSF
jgi:protein disulfide-isomerase A1